MQYCPEPVSPTNIGAELESAWLLQMPSRLSAYLESWHKKLESQQQALITYQHALDAVEQNNQIFKHAQEALQAWNSAHLSEPENAQKATSTSAKKRQAGAPPQSRKTKVNRSAGVQRPRSPQEESEVIDLC